jgi:hypothetical protein
MELYGPTRSKRKTKTLKRVSTSSTEVEQKDENTNLKLKRASSNSSTHKTFPPENQEIQLQIDFDSNRQCCSNVQHQQEIRCLKPVYDNEENMVYDR